jgi:hypothetical protein
VITLNTVFPAKGKAGALQINASALLAAANAQRKQVADAGRMHSQATQRRAFKFSFSGRTGRGVAWSKGTGGPGSGGGGGNGGGNGGGGNGGGNGGGGGGG